MTEPSFPTWPHHAEDEIEAVAALLRSGRVNYWTGSEVRDFEQAYAEYCAVPHAIALANGTLALEAGLIGLGMQPGDEVIVTPRTFIASAAVVALRGGVPVFVDVDRDSQNLDPACVAAAIGPRTVGIIAVHHAGWPCAMDALAELARRHGLWLLEDCAQAHGARIGERPVGALGDAAAFSFCQDKIMSTGGEGGMFLCRDEAVWRRAWSYKDHGKDYQAVQAALRDPAPGVPWVHRSLGSNWRMAGVQAALGRVQLGKLDGWVAARTRNALHLRARLGESPLLRIPAPAAPVRHAYYRLYAFVRPERLRPGWDRNAVVSAIQARGVPCSLGSCSEIYRERGFSALGLGPPAPLPVAHELGETSIAFPVHPSLDTADMTRMADLVLDALAGALA
jgi:dTDP-4-amino-4,6-dideoxygalactose transaminase